jgi:tRNA-splicing endonuclease subunit Sen34
LIDDLRTLPLPLPSSTIDSRQTAFLADIRKQQRTWQREEAERQTQSRQIVLTDAQREKREQRMKEKEEKRKRAEEAARLEAEEEGSALDPTAASSSSLTAPSTATPPVPTSSAPSPLSSQGATAASGGEIAFGHPPSSIPYALSIPSTHSSDHYSTPCSITHTTLSSARSANLWSFPSNLDERARAGVFRALWERGYFMGGGIKFGGELMIYPGASSPSSLPPPILLRKERKQERKGDANHLAFVLRPAGDPLRYHSHFVSTALLGMDEVIRPMQLVAWGRLGTATKKAHLLCGWSDEEKEVEFFSLEWASF